jgi:hypothetical protein
MSYSFVLPWVTIGFSFGKTDGSKGLPISQGALKVTLLYNRSVWIAMWIICGSQAVT